MGYIDETTEKGRTVERLIRFMKAVENPSWMIDLVEDMNNKVNMYEDMRDKIIKELEEIKNPMYREDGSLMAQKMFIRIDEAIEIVKRFMN